MLCSLIQINHHIAERLANLIIDIGGEITPRDFTPYRLNPFTDLDAV